MDNLKRLKKAKKSNFTSGMRLCVYRSNKYIYAQIIHKQQGKSFVLASASSCGLKGSGNNCAAAEIVGKMIAKEAMNLKLPAIPFDRRGYKYIGRVAALAEAARKEGSIK